MSDRQATSITGRVVEEGAIQKLAVSVRGELLRPGGEGYESARRVWNWAIDRHPAMIVRCAGTADVIRAIDFVRTHDLLVAVRGGGHSYVGHSICDSGMVIDLSFMKGIEVDPARRLARAEAGITVGEFDKATQAFGLATPMGACPAVGIAGLTLGGGFGLLIGKYGASCDNLLSVEVVTADGRVLTANARENEDLFWGVRGGGGNFGVATAFEYRLYSVDQVLGGVVTYPISETKEVLRFFREFTSAAPDELVTVAGRMSLPDGPAFGIGVCYCGDLQTGEKALRPLRSFGRPVADLIRPMPYLEFQAMASDVPSRERLSSFFKNSFLRELSDEAIDVIVANVAKAPSPTCIFSLLHFHGAVCGVGRGGTAFPHREAGYYFWMHSHWQDSLEADSSIAWVRGFGDAMQSFSDGAVYVNELSDEGEEWVKAAYGANYTRLVALKNKYDPTNFFRLNQNIKPTV